MAITYSIYREALNRASCSFAFDKVVKVSRKPFATLTGALESAMMIAERDATCLRVVQTPTAWGDHLPYVEVWGNGTAKFMPRMLPLLLAELRTNQALAARAMASLGVL